MNTAGELTRGRREVAALLAGGDSARGSAVACAVHGLGPPDGLSMDDDTPGDGRPRAEYETWHLHDAGGPALRLKVRYRERAAAGVSQRAEAPDWRDGPDLPEALERAAAEGWHAFDREPGGAPGEYAIVHLVREAPAR